MTSIWEMVTWVVSFSSDWSGHGSALIWRYGSLVFHTGIWSCDSETGPCHYQKSDVDQRCDLILETKILRYCGPDLLIMNVSLFWTINWKKVRFNWNSFILISEQHSCSPDWCWWWVVCSSPAVSPVITNIEHSELTPGSMRWPEMMMNSVKQSLLQMRG